MSHAMERLEAAFGALTARERQLLTCALAGNHPDSMVGLRMPVLRALARADGAAQAAAGEDALVEKVAEAMAPVWLELSELERNDWRAWARAAVAAVREHDKEEREVVQPPSEGDPMEWWTLQIQKRMDAVCAERDRLQQRVAELEAAVLTDQEAKGVLVGLFFGVPPDEPDEIASARVKLRALAVREHDNG